MAQRIDLPVEFQFKVEPVKYVRGAIRLRKWWLGYGPWELQAEISAPAEFAGFGRADDLFHVSPEDLPVSVRAQLGEPEQRLSSAVKKLDLDVFLCIHPDGYDFYHPPKGRVIDPWHLRHDFLHLRPTSGALLEFLNQYGRWSGITYPRLETLAFYDP